MGIVVVGAVFVDIKGYPDDLYVPTGRNIGRIDYVHGGVSRNVVEDIANVELRPTFLGIVDDGPLGEAVVQKLRNHKVDTQYIPVVPDSMGTWLAVFDHKGDLAGSISKRPNMMPLLEVLEEMDMTQPHQCQHEQHSHGACGCGGHHHHHHSHVPSDGDRLYD